MKRRTLIGSMLAVLPGTATAQTRTAAVDNIGSALPPDIVSAIQAASNVRTIFPVQGTERFDGQILKADEIVFGEGARLVLTADADWIVVAARRWKFAAPNQMTRIQRDMSIVLAKAPDGGSGSHGPHRPGETNRRGNDGGNGGPGATGSTGVTRNTPKIYLIAGDLQTPDGSPLPGYLRLSLIFPGIRGGDGGNGGPGGNGGNAGNGKEGATQAFDCREGGGPGGTGGSSGPGGRGGRGGRGGNGADIMIISLAEGTELFSYASIVNVGGEGGNPGDPGRAGQPGRGGRGAPRNGWCSNTQDGGDGTRPTPRDLGSEPEGDDGQKGAVVALTVKNLSPIF